VGQAYVPTRGRSVGSTSLKNLSKPYLYPAFKGISLAQGFGPDVISAQFLDNLYNNVHLRPIWDTLVIEIAETKRDHGL
jgi:hypothetical protein